MGSVTYADTWLECIHQTWPDYTMTDEEKAAFNAKHAHKAGFRFDDRTEEQKDRAEAGYLSYMDKLGY